MLLRRRQDGLWEACQTIAAASSERNSFRRRAAVVMEGYGRREHACATGRRATDSRR